jgi:hypothetical protein
MSAAAPAPIRHTFLLNRLCSKQDMAAHAQPALLGGPRDMEHVLAEFGLDLRKTQVAVARTGAMIAGSAVTAALTKMFMPNDIDIWVRLEADERLAPIKDGVRILDHEQRAHNSATNCLRLSTLDALLTESGYKVDSTVSTDHYYRGMTASLIHDVTNYIKDGKRVQLISTKLPLSKMLDDFDLSICCCWWQGDDIFCRYPLSLLRREMWLCGDHVADLDMIKPSRKAHRFRRIQKYIERGFTPSAALKVSVDNYLRTLKPKSAVAGAGVGAGAGASAAPAPKATDGVCTTCKVALMEVYHCLSDAGAAHLDRKTTTDGVCSLCKA